MTVVFILLTVSITILLALIIGLISSIFPWLILKIGLKNSSYQKDKTLTNTDALKGQTGIVVLEIDRYKKGYVKIEGESWLAKSVDDQTIPAGRIVEVIAVAGCHVEVKAITYY